MAMERVTTVQLWPHVGDGLNEFIGFMLLSLAVMGGSPCIPTIFLGFGLVCETVRKGCEIKARLH